MRRASDIPPLDEFDPYTAQVLLGDNPTAREMMREIVRLVKERTRESGNAEMIELLPELDRALEAHMADPEYIGVSLVRLHDALRLLLKALGINPANFGLL